MSSAQSGTDTRAQSETLGFVLVLGIVITGALLVAALGAIALSDTEDSLSVDRAETVLTQLDAKAGLVALGESSSQQVSLSSDERDQFSVEEDNGVMEIIIYNRTSEQIEWSEQFTLGAVVWEGNGERLAYQGGGVWRADDSGGQMISPPEFHFRGATLTLPMVRVTGDGVLSSDATITRAGSDIQFPREDIVNPLEEHEVSIVVQSEFYRGWAEYLAARTDGEVSINTTDQSSEIDLVSRIGETFVSGAVAGQTVDGDLTFQANPHHPCGSGVYFEGYDSDEIGPGESYCDNYDSNDIMSGGELIFGGDIFTQAAAGETHAGFTAGGGISLHGNQEVHGDIRYTEYCEIHSGPGHDCSDVQPGNQYDLEQIDGVETEPAIDRVIEQTLNEANATLDQTTFGNGDEISGGIYYTDELDITGSLVFNTTEDDISLVVENGIQFDGATVDIVGDGEVDIFVGGTDGDNDLHMDSSTVTVPEYDASKLTILGDSDFTGFMDDGDFTGVIYAPGEDDSDAHFLLVGGGNMFGAVVTGDMEVGDAGGEFGAGGTVHYDHALGNQIVVPPDFGITRLTYLHISDNQIVFNN